jgi:hypothetical protein
MKTVDIVVKTFPGDYPWLPYLWRSIEKYVTGARDLIIIIEQQYESPPMPPGAKLVRCRQYEGTACPPSRGVPIERLGAWRHSDVDVLLFVDSDCVFCRPVDLQTDPTINVERPVVLFTDWVTSGPCQKWRAPAANALGFDPPYLTMCRYPFVFPTNLMQACWNACGQDAGLRMVDLTDWEVIGNFALVCFPRDVTPVHATHAGPKCVHQFWSQGGVTHPLTQEDILVGKMGGGVNNPGVQAEMRRLGLC